MAGVPFFIEEYPDLVVDYREDCPGDSFGNSWPFFFNDRDNFIGITIHHTAGPKTQSIDDIAWYHVNSRGWGGVGYHFLIKDGKAYYVGDLNTGRSHVAGLNDKYIGVCIVGNYQEESPDDQDLRVAHLLCREFIENEPDRFKNVDSWDNVKPHRALTSTACPGNTYPNWWNKIIMGVDDSSECKKKLEQCEIDKKKEAERGDYYKEQSRERKDKIDELEKQYDVCKKLCEEYENKLNTEKELHAETRKKLGGAEKYNDVLTGNLEKANTKIQKLEAENEILREDKASIKNAFKVLSIAFEEWIKRKFGGEVNNG